MVCVSSPRAATGASCIMIALCLACLALGCFFCLARRLRQGFQPARTRIVALSSDGMGSSRRSRVVLELAVVKGSSLPSPETAFCPICLTDVTQRPGDDASSEASERAMVDAKLFLSGGGSARHGRAVGGNVSISAARGISGSAGGIRCPVSCSPMNQDQAMDHCSKEGEDSSTGQAAAQEHGADDGNLVTSLASDSGDSATRSGPEDLPRSLTTSSRALSSPGGRRQRPAPLDLDALQGAAPTMAVAGALSTDRAPSPRSPASNVPERQPEEAQLSAGRGPSSSTCWPMPSPAAQHMEEGRSEAGRSISSSPRKMPREQITRCDGPVPHYFHRSCIETWLTTSLSLFREHRLRDGRPFDQVALASYLKCPMCTFPFAVTVESNVRVSDPRSPITSSTSAASPASSAERLGEQEPSQVEPEGGEGAPQLQADGEVASSS